MHSHTDHVTGFVLYTKYRHSLCLSDCFLRLFGFIFDSGQQLTQIEDVATTWSASLTLYFIRTLHWSYSFSVCATVRFLNSNPHNVRQNSSITLTFPFSPVWPEGQGQKLWIKTRIWPDSKNVPSVNPGTSSQMLALGGRVGAGRCVHVRRLSCLTTTFLQLFMCFNTSNRGQGKACNPSILQQPLMRKTHSFPKRHTRSLSHSPQLNSSYWVTLCGWWQADPLGVRL